MMMFFIDFSASPVLPELSPMCSTDGAVKDCRTLKATVVIAVLEWCGSPVVTAVPEWYGGSLHSTRTATALYSTTLIAMY